MNFKMKTIIMSKNVLIHPKIKLMISMCTALVINKLITQYYVKMTVLSKFYKMIKNFTLIQHYHQLIAYFLFHRISMLVKIDLKWILRWYMAFKMGIFFIHIIRSILCLNMTKNQPFPIWNVKNSESGV